MTKGLIKVDISPLVMTSHKGQQNMGMHYAGCTPITLPTILGMARKIKEISKLKLAHPISHGFHRPWMESRGAGTWFFTPRPSVGVGDIAKSR